MIVLEEGELRFEFTDANDGYTFDETDPSNPNCHGLSRCMKAVDFRVEFNDKYLFVEIKDPPCRAARLVQRVTIPHPTTMNS